MGDVSNPIWIILALVLSAIFLIAGTTLVVKRRNQLQRAERWKQLENRISQVETESVRIELDPTQAFSAPGWLDSSNPLVRSFTSTLRATRNKKDTIHAVASKPREEQITALTVVVEQLEDTFAETDRAIRSSGWSTAASLQLENPQFMLDTRWGRPASLPALGPTEPENVDASVRAFVNACFPLRKQVIAEGLRRRTSGRGYKAARNVQKSFEHLIATQRLRVDDHDIVWPVSVRTIDWGVYRSFGPDAEVKLKDIPRIEIANAIWETLPAEGSMTEQEVLALVVDQLQLKPSLGSELSSGLHKGIKALPSSVQKAVNTAVPESFLERKSTPQWNTALNEGLDEALATSRIQRQSDGSLQRLRTTWPASYR